MDTRQLGYFVEVATRLNFTRAAEHLHTAQSTLSGAVRGLEDDLGVALLDRSSRQVRLTPAGEAFLAEARRVLQAAQSARSAAQRAGGRVQGTVRFGTMPGLTALDLPGLVRDLRLNHPLVDIRITVSTTGSAGLGEEVARGRLDAAVVATPAHDAPELDLHRFATVPFVAVLPAGHRLSGAADVSPADLAGERFVCAAAGYANRTAVDRCYAALGLERRVVVEVADIRVIADYVAAAQAAAVMPQLDFGGRRDIAVLPLRAGPAPLDLSLAVLAGAEPSPAVARLLELVPPHTSGRPLF